jgi:exodeoxyribonuclease VII large subunit
MSQPSFDFDADASGIDAVDDGGVPTFSVGELAEAINASLRRSFTDGVWVRGEIHGWSERGPHAYFRIVEDTPEGGRAVLNVQLFAPVRVRMRPMLAKHRMALADGMKVRIFGHLDLYAPSGQLGLKMAGIDPRYTLGEMMIERQEVVRRLVASGLYDANRGRSLAAVPLRVGVVTSIDSAAWADFRHELERSALGFHVRVLDVRVQGELAVSMISAAVRSLGRRDDLDVVVIVRGGGARTELAVFDHERIATEIGRCPLPVLTGLGHEIDRSVADEVAHLSLKTPTACATALVERVLDARARTERVWSAIAVTAQGHLARADQRLSHAAHGVGRRTVAAVERADERLVARARRVTTASQQVLERQRLRVAAAGAALTRAPRRLDAHVAGLESATTRLRLLDPAHTLARGWSITRRPDGSVVRAADHLRPGDEVITTFATGSAISRVEDTIP